VDASTSTPCSIAAPDTAEGSGSGRSLEVFSDGCYQPEDGTGGWAFVAYRQGVEIATEFGCVDRSSNNAMELTALLRAARWINANTAGTAALLWSDSVYAVNGCNHWRPIWKSRDWRKRGPDPRARSRSIADRELWIAIDEALSCNQAIQIAWCKGHSGIPGNEKSDALAELGRRSARANAARRNKPA
jgi:ribonuclease HI